MASRQTSSRAEARRPSDTLLNSIRVGIGVLFGIGVPLGLNVFLPEHITPTSNAIIIICSWGAGLAAILVLETVERSQSVERGLRELQTDVEVKQTTWTGITDFDQLLIEIRHHFQELQQHARADPDLFGEYYVTRLRGLCRQLTLSASSDQLQINQSHFDTTEILMNCLTGDTSDDILAVHFLRSNSFIEDVPHPQRFLGLIQAKVDRGEIRAVRRIFVVDDDSDGRERAQLTDEFSRYLIGFHEHAHGFDYRILPLSTYLRYMSDSDPDTQIVPDFGVYGEKYVYETSSATAQAIQGVWNSSFERVTLYRRHFERCWGAGRAYDSFVADPLPVVAKAADVFDPFFRKRHYKFTPLRVTQHHVGDKVERESVMSSPLQITNVTSTAGSPPALAQVGTSIVTVLEEVSLCAIATASPEGMPYVNTCFFAYSRHPLRLWVLTPPSTIHSSYIEKNGEVAVAVYSTNQGWSTPKRGLQLFGQAKLVPDAEVALPLEIYGTRYSAFLSILRDPNSLSGLESRFYEITIKRIRVFDETSFGPEVWLDVDLVA